MASARSSYSTLREGVVATGEFTDRKSRFIAHLKHINSQDEAAEFIAQVRAKHYDARHNVPAQILHDGFEKASDDGEPSRTAGLPVLDVLRGENLKDVSCVVTRYFGGTLLGPGGLVRAYSAATQAAVEAARVSDAICEMTSVTPVEVRVPYSSYERIRNLAERSGARVVNVEYAADVVLYLVFKTGDENAFLDAMVELMAGKNCCVIGSPVFSEF